MYKEKDIEVGALKEEIGAFKLRIQQLESKNEDSASLLLSDKVTKALPPNHWEIMEKASHMRINPPS